MLIAWPPNKVYFLGKLTVACTSGDWKAAETSITNMPLLLQNMTLLVLGSSQVSSHGLKRSYLDKIQLKSHRDLYYGHRSTNSAVEWQ